MSIGYLGVLQRLKEERILHGMTQQDLGSRIGISQGHCCKVEQADKRLTYPELVRLAETEVDLYYVFTNRRVRQVHKDLFQNCSFKELLCYLSMTASLAMCMYDERQIHLEDDLYRQLCCIQYIVGTGNRHEETIFTLLKQRENETQQGMAEQLGVNVKTYRALEQGTRLPDSELVWKLYDVCKVPPALIIKDTKGIVCEIEYLMERLGKRPNGAIYKYFCLLHKYYLSKR